jgi:hypothetical protein
MFLFINKCIYNKREFWNHFSIDIINISKKICDGWRLSI